jgi:hypothetical protein
MNPPSSEAGYALWTIPGTSFLVTYSLGVFHEIDFVVNESYRRISHGGIEIGGLLFGHAEESSARIEAFRPIECEHALGPSFVLSERDLASLKNQIETAASDPELAGLELIGWFISHTRSQLQINDRELAWFNQFFPDAGKITLLIKPERFQATRFAFLVRTADGQIDRDGSQKAIILPLPGRVARDSEQPIPSIPAPPERQPAEPPEHERFEPANLPEFRPMRSFDETIIQPPRTKQLSRASRTPVPEMPAIPAPEERPSLEERELVQEAEQSRSPLAEPETETQLEAPIAPPFTENISAEPASPTEEIGTGGSEALPFVETPEPPSSQQFTRGTERTGKHQNTRLTLVLILAALLGCAAGYWGWTQFPSPAIPLTIRVENSRLVVAWPPEQTRTVAYAAIRVDDGTATPLSPAQKTAGEITLDEVSGNMKVELVARHWIRDSRGIVRFVTAVH